MVILSLQYTHTSALRKMLEVVASSAKKLTSVGKHPVAFYRDVSEPFSITKAKVIHLPVLYLHGDSQSSVHC